MELFIIDQIKRTAWVSCRHELYMYLSLMAMEFTFLNCDMFTLEMKHKSCDRKLKF